MNLDLHNKNAIVCGSTQGIGKCIAIELAKLGAKVTLIARNEDALKAAVQELDGNGHDYLVADFSNPDQLKEKIAGATANKNYNDFTIFNDHIKESKNNKIISSGNPIKSVFKDIEHPKYKYARETRIHNILIFGGSQGAMFFSENIPISLTEFSTKLNVKHICGLNNKIALQNTYKRLNIAHG